MAPNYLAMNRNKRSIVLDLRQDQARAVLQRLIEEADVFFSNLRPAAMERHSLGYEAVAAINPRIIYCIACGFGEEGRYAGRPALDDLMQGAAALPWLVQQVSGKAHFLPTNMCDRVTGLTAVYSVTSALYARERTGRGQFVEVPMFETMAQFVLSDHLHGNTFDPPHGEPGYPRLLSEERVPFRTRDGHVCVLVFMDKHWRKFCDMVGRPEVATDPRFADLKRRIVNANAANAFIAEQLLQRTTAEWLDAFAEADLPAMPMHSVTSMLDDPHLADVQFFRWIEHPSEGRIRSMGIPTKFSDTPGTVRRHAPLLGENTVDILAEAGYSQAGIDDLLRSGSASAARSQVS